MDPTIRKVHKISLRKGKGLQSFKESDRLCSPSRFECMTFGWILVHSQAKINQQSFVVSLW